MLAWWRAAVTNLAAGAACDGRSMGWGHHELDELAGEQIAKGFWSVQAVKVAKVEEILRKKM